MIPTRTPAVEETIPTPKRCNVAHAWLPAEIYIAIEVEAKRRGMLPDQLLAEITIRLARKKSFRAIVDQLLDRN